MQRFLQKADRIHATKPLSTASNMTTKAQYASNQPDGFHNHLRNIAVVGAGGSVGKYITEALLKTGRHNVTAISRVNSKNELPPGVKVVSVDHEKQESLVEAL